MFLKTDHTGLRALEPTDLDFLYTLENDVRVWHVGNTHVPFSKYVLEQYIQNATQDIYTVKQLRLVICNQAQEAVGAIDLFDFDPMHRRAGVGIVIAANQRENGHATDALHMLLRYCGQTLMLHQVYCSVTANNSPSISLFEKAGFKKVGTRKDWMKTPNGWNDVVEMQYLFG